MSRCARFCGLFRFITPIMLTGFALNSCVNPLPPPGSPGMPYQGPAQGLEDLRRVTLEVGTASGGQVAQRVVYGQDPGPTCSIRGRGTAAVVEVNPRAAREIPLNSWAFIIGHEFAHQVTGIGLRGQTTPEIEKRMDLLGADYARRAGFDVADHVGWVFSQRDVSSPSHGSSHDRAEALARRYGLYR